LIIFNWIFGLSIKEEYFWRYCDFKTYRNKYKERLNEFIKQYGPDVSEVDFIDAEKETIEKGFLSYSFPKDDYSFDRAAIEISFLDQKIQKRLTYSKNRKLNFLESELKKIEKHSEFYADYDEKILPPNYIRDLRNRNEILARFITSTDTDKKLELLPYSDFLKRYNQLTEREQIAFLSELKRIISNGAISKAYLLKEWQRFNLKAFVNSEFDSINRIDNLENEMHIYKDIERKIKSNLPVNEIKEHLLEFKYNILGNKDKSELSEVNLRVFNFIDNQIKYLNEASSQNVLSAEKNEIPNNPHPFIFPKVEHWQVFKQWKEETVHPKADLVFIYWQMKEDGMMNEITPTQYINWLFKHLQFDLEGYWKQFDRLNTPERLRAYSNLIRSIK